MSTSDAMVLCFASGVPYGFRDRQRFAQVPKIKTTTICKALSSHQIEGVFANTKITHTRQNKPYRLGVVPGEVVGARGRCCTAATVPVAVVFACGVCCCVSEEIKNNIIDRKTELCHRRPPNRAHSNEYENNAYKSFKMGFWVCGSGGVRDVHVLSCTRVVQIGVAHTPEVRTVWECVYYSREQKKSKQPNRHTNKHK